MKINQLFSTDPIKYKSKHYRKNFSLKSQLEGKFWEEKLF